MLDGGGILIKDFAAGTELNPVIKAPKTGLAHPPFFERENATLFTVWPVPLATPVPGRFRVATRL